MPDRQLFLASAPARTKWPVAVVQHWRAALEKGRQVQRLVLP
jgi:hypothetical protein